MEDLITKHIGLAYYIANKFRSTGEDLEELQATALLGLVKAAKSYDPERKIKFNTYAVKVMQNEILMLLRKERRRRAHLAGSLQDEFAEGLTVADTIPDPRCIEAEVETRILTYDLLHSLNGRERIVVQMRAQNCSQERIGRKLGVKQPIVSKIMKKIRQRAAV